MSDLTMDEMEAQRHAIEGFSDDLIAFGVGLADFPVEGGFRE